MSFLGTPGAPRFGLARMGVEGESALDAQITVQLAHVGFEVRVGERIDHVPLLHDVVAVSDRAGEVVAAFRQDDRVTLLLEAVDGAPDLLHDDWCKPPRSAHRAGS